MLAEEKEDMQIVAMSFVSRLSQGSARVVTLRSSPAAERAAGDSKRFVKATGTTAARLVLMLLNSNRPDDMFFMQSRVTNEKLRSCRREAVICIETKSAEPSCLFILLSKTASPVYPGAEQEHEREREREEAEVRAIAEQKQQQ